MSDSQPSFDSILELCASQCRRIVLSVLSAEQGPVTLNELTRTVVKNSRDSSRTEISDDVLTDVRTSLYHNHLPKLSSEGLITYEPDTERVETTEQLGRARPTVSMILDADPKLETPIKLESRSRLL